MTRTRTKKTPKVAGPKKTAITATIGHNSTGKVIPAFVGLLDELLAIGERKKALAKAERDLRNKAKTEFGFLSGPLAFEVRMRKLDPDVRVQFESCSADIKVASGYQPSLDFEGGVPTQVSVKAQPSEGEMQKASFKPSPDDEAVQEEEAAAVKEQQSKTATNVNLGVIQREG